MTERALVAVLQADDFRRVEGGDRIALQVLVLGLDAFLVGFLFALEVFLVAQLGDQRLAFVGLPFRIMLRLCAPANERLPFISCTPGNC
jgi:hypothetical protein